jgi:glycosyltransferase involved in cell wall biosynthesis
MITKKYPYSFNEAIVSGEIKNPFYLSQTLKRMNHDVTIITHNTSKSVRSFNGIKICDIGEGFLKGVIRSTTRNLKGVKKFLELIKEEDFDIIHAHYSIAGLILLKKSGRINIPIITTAHGTTIPELYADIEGSSFYNTLARLNGWAQRHIDRFAWLNSNKIISAGNYQVSEMLEVYKLPKEKIIPISNGVDTSFYKPDTDAGNKIREKPGLEDKRVVLFVGRLARKKGLQYLIDAALLILNEFPNTIFLVIGGTNQFAQYESELRKRITYLNLEEKFIVMKNVPENDMPAYYNSTDVCVVPSINYEPLPTVVFEAMACGKPIVASNLDGIPEQIGYEDTLVPQKNSKALAEKIIEILRDKELSDKLSKNNRERAEELDWMKIAENHVKVYRGVRV